MQLVIMTLLKLFNEDHKTIGGLYHETTDAIRVKPLADVITRIVTMVTELPYLAIERKYIVKGKEIQQIHSRKTTEDLIRRQSICRRIHSPYNRECKKSVQQV